jgi:amidohydrolase
MKQRILPWVEAHAPALEEVYHQLHAKAERSWQETQTTAYLQQALQEMDVPWYRFSDHPGAVAEWSGDGAGPTVVLRSDIDALWQNVDGTWKANHSCGHDAHMTMVLFALRCLKEIGFAPSGTLRVVFQPAEETGEGAQAMVRRGVMEGADYLLGIHVRPLKEMVLGQASSAIYHGAALFLEGQITGRQAHASRPNDGINVIDSLAAITQAVNAVKVDPTLSASCKITRIKVPNESVNLIPDSAEFAVDLRAQTNAAMDVLLLQLENAIRCAGMANGAEVRLRTGARMVAAIPNPLLEKVVGEAIEEVLSSSGRVAPPVTPGAEDFHFYPLLQPELLATMIGLGTNLTPGLHHPHMKFDLSSLRAGTAILALSALKLFEFGSRR